MLNKRLQDYEYEIKSQEHLSTMQRGFEERMRALEARAPRQQRSWVGPQYPAAGVSGGSSPAGRQSWAARRATAASGEGRTALGEGRRARAGPVTSAAAPASGGAVAAADDVVPRDGNKRVISDRIAAVKELQKLVRTRLGLPVDKDNGVLEPCAWAQVGGCIKQNCQPCAGGLRMPDDILQAVKARCHAKVFRVRGPAKKPG